MNYALIFAGGTGQRMNNQTRPKQFLELYGKPVIVYTLEQFQRHGGIDGIVVACLGEWIGFLEGLVERYGLTKREREILGYLARGRSAKYISDTLVISDNTTWAHIKRIYAKTGVHSKQELMSLVEHQS